MNKKTYKTFILFFLFAIPATSFATFVDCRKAGGSWIGCFYEAAMNDQIVPPGESDEFYARRDRYAKRVISLTVQKYKKSCSKLKIEEQKECLSKGLRKIQRRYYE